MMFQAGCAFRVCMRILILMFLTLGSLTPHAFADGLNTNNTLMVKGLDFGGEAPLQKPLWVRVENLESWLKKKDADLSKFELCINGMPLRESYVSGTRSGNYLGFVLPPTSTAQMAWKSLVSPPLEIDGQLLSVNVRLDGKRLEGDATARLIIFPKYHLWIFLGVVASIIAVCVWLAKSTDIIRESGRQPSGTDSFGLANRKPYSLGRTQMAAWFIVVFLCFIFIWLITGDIKTLTSTALMLIGISTGTALGSAAIDSSKRFMIENSIRAAEDKKKKTEIELVRLQSLENSTSQTSVLAPAVIPEWNEPAESSIRNKAEIDSKKQEVLMLSDRVLELNAQAEPLPSLGFLNDILKDNQGVSFHRFQMLAWTAVLIVIFISSVIETLTMLDFDSTLLALMGLSGGTFLGFKLPGQQG